ARAEGNPLFLEELSLAARERDREAVAVVPATIEEVLAMRVGRLRPRPRQLLGMAAVIGREGPLSLLRAVSRLSDQALEETVEHLQRSDFLTPARVGTDTGHVFKHVLVQEVAYARIEATERCDLHLLALESIERLYADAIAEHVEVLAHHAVAAQEWARAVPYLYRASRKARGRAAHAEQDFHP